MAALVGDEKTEWAGKWNLKKRFSALFLEKYPRRFHEKVLK